MNKNRTRLSKLLIPMLALTGLTTNTQAVNHKRSKSVNTQQKLQIKSDNPGKTIKNNKLNGETKTVARVGSDVGTNLQKNIK